ncbi:phosphatase PAP2 family protein [Aridibaculum aurantiacum]|uniref:phosphatase PAP2 family protein n=1 Tax=Aridibaculum aurantiacum TaxID=2810307 RepID=UPI001A96A1EB|nr:phosphatase PAP2 family protein [Aridibaculum aurantiacum]
MKRILLTSFIALFSFSCFSQDTTSTSSIDSSLLEVTPAPPIADTLMPLAFDHSNAVKDNTKAFSPYTTRFKTEAAIIGASVAVNYIGFQLIRNKRDLTPDELARKTPDRLMFMDRWNAGYYSAKADRDSYILFNGSYVYPLAIMLLDKKQRQKFGQLAVLYLETIGITGSMYTLTAGLVYRSRPYVYGNIAPVEMRMSKGAQRSFYGGHVATTAAFSFFTAQVFRDFHPNSKLRPYVWSLAAVLPAIMAYERYKAGYHFLSDSFIAYTIGAATGILVPHLHKNKKLKDFSLKPTVVNGAQGLSMVYKIR